MSEQLSKPSTLPVPERRNTDPRFALNATVTLNFPIKIGGIEQTELTLRRPKVSDRLVVDRDTSLTNEGDRVSTMIGNLCGLSPDEMRLLDLSDFNQLQEAMGRFLDARPTK